MDNPVNFSHATFSINTRAWYCIVLLMAFCAAGTAEANTLVTPRVSVRAEYDDNVRFTRTDPVGDGILGLRPSVELQYRTERLESNTSAAVRALRYLEESDLNREEILLDSSLSYGLLERLSLQGDVSYHKDSALESELEETGLVTHQEDRVFMSAGGGFIFHLTELQELGGSFSLSQTEYDGDRFTDYDTSHAALSWTRRFRNQRDALILQPYWSSNTSDASEVKTLGFMVGWNRMLTEKWSLKAFAGLRRTQTEYQRAQQEVVFDPNLLPAFPFRLELETSTQEETSWGGVADVSFRWTGETWRFDVSYNRDLSYTSQGEPIERDRLGLSVRKRLTKRLIAQCSATGYLSQYDGQFSEAETRHVIFSPSISYRLTETHQLSAGFRYDVNEDASREDTRRDRKRIWVSVDFAFPQIW